MMKRRILAVLLLITLIALPLVEASAASTRYIKSPDGKKVNLRTGPSEKGYAVAAQVEPGTKVTLISSKNGWSEIRYNGYNLYVMTKYLSSKEPGTSSSSSSASTASTTKRYITSKDGKKVNLRTGPGEKGYAVAVQVEPGTEVRFVSRKNGWSKVIYNDFTLYVQNQYLTTKAPGSSTTTATTTSTSTRYITSRNLQKVNARTGPSVKGYAVAAQLEPGTEVKFVSRKNGWSKIIYNGYTLYVQNQYLTAKKPE